MIAEIRSHSVTQILLRDLPPMAISLAVAELFFKLGSFTAECLAFLALWYALDLVGRRLLPEGGRAKTTNRPRR